MFLPHHDHEPIKPLLFIQGENHSSVCEYHLRTKVPGAIFQSERAKYFRGV
jgi:hypothetical protein